MNLEFASVSLRLSGSNIFKWAQYVYIVLSKGGFSEFPYIFVLSNVCAFVLMCLFVGNSRQTTSSVPWHRAPKYERKLNSHLILKQFLLKWAPVLCMRRKQVCATSETTVWLQEGDSEKASESECLAGQSVWSSNVQSEYTFLRY